jgi:hypothetical protein
MWTSIIRGLGLGASAASEIVAWWAALFAFEKRVGANESAGSLVARSLRKLLRFAVASTALTVFVGIFLPAITGPSAVVAWTVIALGALAIWFTIGLAAAPIPLVAIADVGIPGGLTAWYGRSATHVISVITFAVILLAVLPHFPALGTQSALAVTLLFALLTTAWAISGAIVSPWIRVITGAIVVVMLGMHVGGPVVFGFGTWEGSQMRRNIEDRVRHLDELCRGELLAEQRLGETMSERCREHLERKAEHERLAQHSQQSAPTRAAPRAACPRKVIDKLGPEHGVTLHVTPGEWSCPVRAYIDGAEFHVANLAPNGTWEVRHDGVSVVRFIPNAQNGAVAWEKRRLSEPFPHTTLTILYEGKSKHQIPVEVYLKPGDS